MAQIRRYRYVGPAEVRERVLSKDAVRVIIRQKQGGEFALLAACPTPTGNIINVDESLTPIDRHAACGMVKRHRQPLAHPLPIPMRSVVHWDSGGRPVEELFE